MKDECKSYRDLLVEEALGEIGERERVFLKAHLAACAGCRRELAALADVAGVMKRERIVEAPAGLAERTFHRLASTGERLAAAAWSCEGTEILKPSTWRIRKSLVAWVVAASVLVMAVAALVPEMVGYSDRHKISVCQEHMRIVATALRQYAADHSGFYPEGAEWYTSLDHEYLRSQGALTCPTRLAVGRPSEAETDYVYNRERVSIHSGGDYPLLWDRKAAHGPGRNVLFATGQVKWVEEDRFNVILARHRIEEAEAYY